MRETQLNRARDSSKVETPSSKESLFPSLDPHSKRTVPFYFIFSYLRKAKHMLLSESSCRQRDNISRDDNVDIGSNSCRPSDFHLFFEGEIFLQQRLKELSIKGLTRAGFRRRSDKKVGRDKRGMKPLAKKVFVLLFCSPASIGVERKFLLRNILGNNPTSKTMLFSYHDFFLLKEVIQT